MKKGLLVLLTFAVVLTGCDTSSGVISYSLGGLKNVEVKISTAQKLPMAAEDLQGAGEECGTKQPLKHYQDVLKGFDGSSVSTYTFTAKNNPENYQVLVAENKPEYKNVDEFKKDFDICAAGGIYPSKVSEKYLLFVGSCGGAAPDVAPAVSCSDIQDALDKSLKLNQ